MAKPTAREKWGSLEEETKRHQAELMVIMGTFFLVGACASVDHQFIFFFWILAILAVDELFRRCAELPPDEAAWRELLQRYGNDIRLAIYRTIGFPPHGHHVHIYHDVLQGVYLRLLENERRPLRSFRGKTDYEAKAFLCRVAASVAFNLLQREPPPQVSLEEPKRLRYGETLQDQLAFDEKYFILRQTIDDCLEKIFRGKKQERKILIFKLAFFDGLSPGDIAGMPGFEADSPHAIEQQLSRLRRKAWKYFEENKIFQKKA